MASDDTRKLLKVFGVAVTSLEDAIDRKAPLDEIPAPRGDHWRAECTLDV